MDVGAVGEATLLAVWMTYDSAPTSLLAQSHLVQALALAQAGNDRLLGASILDAMSRQATFAGRFTDAANLACAALTGTRGIAPPTAGRTLSRDGSASTRPPGRRQGVLCGTVSERDGV